MPLKSTLEQLEAVEEAIDRILSTGESVSVDGGYSTSMRLANLQAREKMLRRRLARETGARPPVSHADMRNGVT